MIAAAGMCLGIGSQVATSQSTTPQPAAPPAAATPTATTQDAGINGSWHFVLDTPGGEREVEVTFTVDSDGKVTGKFGDADVAGTYKDGQLDLNFSFTSEEAGETAPMKIGGKLDETSSLAGNWEFSSYSGTYKATRPQAQPASAPADPATAKPQ